MRIPQLVLLAALALGGTAHAERIKDLASIQGVRVNQLVGYGLVVGLDGTGDQTTQTPFTVQSVINMLTQIGVNLPPGTNLQLKNVAAVMVTADAAAVRPGRAGASTSRCRRSATPRACAAARCCMTPLKGADGQVYAMAQGNVAGRRRGRLGQRQPGDRSIT